MLFYPFQVKCFSYPLTHAERDESLTITDVYENFLGPIKDNLEYQAKRPKGVR